MFTRAQQKIYRPLVDAAWRAHAARQEFARDDASERARWYRGVLLDTCGIYTTKEATKTHDFDALMLAFAEIAGDDYWIGRMAGAEERRWRWKINQRLEDLGLHPRTEAGKHYLEGILNHMGLAEQPVSNLPAEYLRKVFIALHKQARRDHHHREAVA